ncbi:MAG TPA: T9SS type A sorting domain-containing protein, partial [Cryomorphaceae bacterium]|nr:T9SS type A sorting domain-containing protein [Cryomorphaceae bacterium]
VFLLSEDGTEEILRFNVANSALPSDMIMDIEIDHQTGEVFFATEEGLVSYISDATGAGVANECHTVYPNPVRETYDGPISIKGLMRNSEVRITDARGNLIFSDVSKGGNAVWDGRNIDGERVATGVYFALITEPESRSTCTTKILVIK